MNFLCVQSEYLITLFNHLKTIPSGQILLSPKCSLRSNINTRHCWCFSTIAKHQHVIFILTIVIAMICRLFFNFFFQDIIISIICRNYNAIRLPLFGFSFESLICIRPAFITASFPYHLNEVFGSIDLILVTWMYRTTSIFSWTFYNIFNRKVNHHLAKGKKLLLCLGLGIIMLLIQLLIIISCPLQNTRRYHIKLPYIT